MPSGREVEDFPFNRIRRRKKARRGDIFSARRDKLSNFSALSFVEGSFRDRFRNMPMAASGCSWATIHTMSRSPPS